MRDFLTGVVMLTIVGPLLAALLVVLFGTVAYITLIGLVVVTHMAADAWHYGGDIVIAGLYGAAFLAVLVAFAMPVGK